MRWRSNDSTVNSGTKRVVRRFLFVPKELPLSDKSDITETRWLTFTRLVQKAYSVPHNFNTLKFKWQDVCWDKDII